MQVRMGDTIQADKFSLDVSPTVRPNGWREICQSCNSIATTS